MIYNHPIGSIYHLYIANWVIIYHLPPIEGTRKLHWFGGRPPGSYLSFREGSRLECFFSTKAVWWWYAWSQGSSTSTTLRFRQKLKVPNIFQNQDGWIKKVNPKVECESCRTYHQHNKSTKLSVNLAIWVCLNVGKKSRWISRKKKTSYFQHDFWGWGPNFEVSTVTWVSSSYIIFPRYGVKTKLCVKWRKPPSM